MRGTRRVGLKKNITKETSPAKKTDVSPSKAKQGATPKGTPGRRPSHTPKGKGLPRSSDGMDSPASQGGERDPMAMIGVDSPTTSRKWTYERERLLCQMWEEETHLYDSTSHDYRNTHKRQRALLRFSAILKLEVADIETHLKSLRTSFTKVCHLPSGSAADRLTQRQRDIRDLCSFLRAHVRTREGITNLPRRQSPRSKNIEGGAVSAAFRKLAGNNNNDSNFTDDAREDLTVQSTSKGPPTKQPIKRKLVVTSENEDVDDDILICSQEKENTPPYHVKGAKRATVSKKKNDEMMAMLDTRTDLMKDFTDSFSSFVKKKNNTEESTRQVDDFESWSKILGNRVRGLDSKIRGRFMHHVDGLVLDAEEGIWTP